MPSERILSGDGTGIDLATVRDTLSLIHDDLLRAPELEGVRRALWAALAEIDLADAAQALRRGPTVSPAESRAGKMPGLVALRFEKWRPGS